MHIYVAKNFDLDRFSYTMFSPYSCIGLECFEGMKAYKSFAAEPATGTKPIRLFRPDCNMQRLSDSMHRLHFACYDFDKDELTECIKELVRVDQDWIPDGEGYSLYIRPTVIATNPFLYVHGS